MLLAHLLLFGYAYPDDQDRIPAWVMDSLQSAVAHEPHSANGHGEEKICRGTILAPPETKEEPEPKKARAKSKSKPKQPAARERKSSAKSKRGAKGTRSRGSTREARG